MSDKIREALAGMLAIVDESRGVEGYHLNGDIAEWDEFPEVEAARAALAKQPAPAAPVAQEPVAWWVPPMTRPYWGKYAEIDAKDEAARSGGTARAIPLYTAPPSAEQPATVAVPRELLAGGAE